MYSINIQGFLMDFSTAKVMGILNLTPDSFYDGGTYSSDAKVLKQVEKMLHEGADILDLGAFSSRPNAELISEEEEQKRLLPTLQKIVEEFPNAILSVDTYRSSIAQMVVQEGAHIINDISGGLFDPEMMRSVGEMKVPYVLMHMQGEPSSMQRNPSYEDVFKEIFSFFSEQIHALQQHGVHDIILDPGFGFGKSLEHNYELLKKLSYFHALERPLLAGISRKGMIQKLIEEEAKDALNGTTAAHAIALLNGANILRVHDVKEAKEAIRIVDFYQKQ